MILYPFQFLVLDCHANFWHADSPSGRLANACKFLHGALWPAIIRGPGRDFVSGE